MKREIPPLGARVFVSTHKRPFTVRARNDRFAVCTRPYFKTVLYFVLDLKNACRGTENLIFGAGAESVQDCEEMLERVTAGATEVSRRNRVDWDIERVELVS